MRLLMKIGYQDVLFGKGVEVGEILAAFDGMKAVKSEGYGAEQRYVIDGDVDIVATMIADDSVLLPDTEPSAVAEIVDKYYDVRSQLDESRRDVAKLKKQLEAINDAAKPMQEEAS